MHLITTRGLLCAAALAVMNVVGAEAQSTRGRPNFTGSWVLDTALSRGPTLPRALSYTIQHHGDTLTIRRHAVNSQGEFTADLVYGTDGKPWRNSTTQAGVLVQISSVLTWAGDSLVITSELDAGGQTLHQVETWSLDATRHRLVTIRAVDALGQLYRTQLVLVPANPAR